jgi:lambda repressor-like predicted transcriptional regulator
MLQTFIQEKMNENNLSLRAASRKIGIAHTTLIRILDGKPYRQENLVKIATWLDVSPATLVNLMSGDEDPLAKKIVAALQKEGKLAKAFEDVVQAIENGEVQSDIINEIIAFAVFRLEYSRKIKEDILKDV